MSSSDLPPDDQPSGRPIGPSDPESADGADILAVAPPLTPPVAQPSLPAGQPPNQRLGTSTFTIEGRAAPGLFVVGWLGTLLGFAMLLVAVMAGGGTSATVLFIIALVLLAIGLVAAAGSQGIERRQRAMLPYRGPSPFLVFAATVPVSLLAGIALSVPLAIVGVDLDGPFGALLSVSIQAIIYIGLIRLLVVDTGALHWRDMRLLPLDRAAVVEMGRGAVWAVPVIFVTAIVAQILLSIFPVTPTSPLPPTGTAPGFLLSFLAGAVVAPFGEEILFRGFATTAWVRGMGRQRGLIVGALFFAFAHVLTVTGATAGDALGLAIVAFAGRIPVALALGWIFLRRDTIWASFGLHAAFNGVLLVLAEVYSRAL